MQNALIVGSDKSPILHYLPTQNFLLIDDGPLIDELDLPRAKHFNFAKHSFNPLKDISYRTAREFVAVLNAVFPEGENTLTRRYSNAALMDALQLRPRKLSDIFREEPSKKDTGSYDAYLKIKDILRSPVLESVLDGPGTFSLKGTILARLDRAVLGDFDAFVIGALLMCQYRGTVVVPDFGFYAIASHIELIRQGRLVAGVNTFDEVPELQGQLILIEQKIGSRCTPDDARLLATYSGLTPGTNEFNDFIDTRIRGTA